MTATTLPARVRAATDRACATGFTMSCDPDTGRLLAVLAAGVPHRGRVLELGTGTGVGTAWLLHGLEGRDDVELITVEIDPETAAQVETSTWPSWAHRVVGDAVSVTQQSGTFDLVFADAEGGKWTRLDVTIDALRPGGMLVVDDMSPRQFVDEEHADKTAQVRDRLLDDPTVLSVELTCSTGLILCTKTHQDAPRP